MYGIAKTLRDTLCKT